MAEKKYYWLKMTDQFFEDKAIKKLRKIAGGDTYTIIYLKMLLTAIKQGNKMYFEGIEDDFMEELALELDEDTDNVKVTVSYLKSKGLIEVLGADEILLTQCAEMVGSETDAARRKRLQRDRERNRAIGSDPVPALEEKPEVEALMKFKADAEEKEMKEICKRYAILGKTEEELLPVLKSTKAVSQEAYDQVIKTLNDAKAAVENSGTFSEIGKSGHAGASKGPDANSAEGKIDSIAKSYIEKNPTMSYVDALAKAWEDNPQLVLQYEEEAGI